MYPLPKDYSYKFIYDSTRSTDEGRSVSNFHMACPSEQLSIVIPSGTAGFEVWVNSSSEYSRNAQDPAMAHMQPDVYDRLDVFNVTEPSFSANWINITSYPNVTVGDKAFFIEGAVRWVRLQGDSVSGTSVLGYFMTNNMRPV